MDTEILIIGAGVVGLAIASELSANYSNIVIVEKEKSFGMASSSRSSEVIHASIYYPANSLKGKLCLEGNELLYDICSKNNIPFLNSGKLIVACNNDEKSRLEALLHTAKRNGAKGVRIVDKDEISEIEPNVSALAAIYCPSSGYLDSHKLMEYFERNAKSNSVDIAYQHELVDISKIDGGFAIKLRVASGETFEISSKIVINSAGLHSGEIAHIAGIDQYKYEYKINYHKGIYYRVNKKLDLYPKTLIYPVPPLAGSVGVHTTPDLYGGMRLGPHFIWSDTIDYSVDDYYHDYFYESAKSFLPFLEYDDISPDMSGIMSAIQSPNKPEWKDFIIIDESLKGLPGLINLIGMESPALTASPAIAKYVAAMLKL